MSVPNPAAVRRFACGEALRRNQVTLNPPPTHQHHHRSKSAPGVIPLRGHSKNSASLTVLSRVTAVGGSPLHPPGSSEPRVTGVSAAGSGRKGFLWKSDACWRVWHPTCSLDRDGYRVNSSGTVGVDWSFWSFWNRSVESFIKYTNQNVAHGNPNIWMSEQSEPYPLT